MRAVLSLLVCLTVPAYGQSALPPCDLNVAATGWTNCQGTSIWADGHKYVGEFRDGKHHGRGILTFADGRPTQEGVFEDSKFVRAQRIPDHIAGRSTTQIDLARKKCGDLGLKSGTERFGECVLRLSR